jgi:exonuclease III
LAWLETAAPDVVCLQELKTSQKASPDRAIHERLRRGLAWTADMERRRHPDARLRTGRDAP